MIEDIIIGGDKRVYPNYVQDIIDRLENSGESAYIVGGSLRDMLLGIQPHDYDVTTSALPLRTLEIFSDMRVIETGLKHGTVTVISQGEPIEVTTFRIDGEYTDSRHPDSVSFTDDITADLSRRDFTVNAMAYNKERGLVDPFGGSEDVKRGILRAVGDPEKRFTEDALRIMRAFRFSAQLGFSIEENTLKGAVRCAEGLSNIARERIGCEFIKLITSEHPISPLKAMKDNGILKYALGDYAPSEALIDSLPRMPRTDTARLGLLLSETDKDSGREILHGLRCSGKQITGALAVASGSARCVTTAKDARALIAVTGVYATDAALASVLRGISPVGAAEETEKQKNTPSRLQDLKINGKVLSEMGAKGKLIGSTLDRLLTAVIEDPSLNERETLIEMAEKIMKESREQ